MDCGTRHGRSKKEAEQKAPRRLDRAARAPLRRGRRPPTSDDVAGDRPSATDPCPSCPRSRSSAAASTAGSTGRTVAAVEVLHPRAVRRHAAGAADLAARLVGRRGRCRRRGAASTSGCPLGARAARTTASSAHLGMSGQLLVQPPDAPDETHLRVRLALRRRRPRAALRRPAHLRRPRASSRSSGRRRRAVPRRSRTSPATRSTRRSTTRRSPRRCGAGAPGSSGRCSTRRWSPASATSTPTRRCGGPGCTTPAPTETLTPARGRRACSAAAREVMAAALDAGRHLVRRALRQRQRRERLLRPVAGRLRPGRASRARAAARPIRRESFMNRSSYPCPPASRAALGRW